MSQPLTQHGEIFREDFLSPFHVAQNGGAINGNPVIDRRCQTNGTDWITYPKFLWGGVANFSIWVELNELTSVTSQALISGTTVDDPLLRIFSGSTLQFFPAQSISVVNRSVSITEGDLLKLGVSFDNTTLECNFYLNGTKLSSATASGGVAEGRDQLQLFTRINGNDPATVDAHTVRIFNKVLTDDQFEKLYNGKPWF